MFLLENGHILIFWIGRQVSSEFINNVFGVDSIEKINSKLVCILLCYFYIFKRTILLLIDINEKKILSSKPLTVFPS